MISTRFAKIFTTPLFFLVLTMGGFFGFSYHHLTQFVTADEHYWVYERIPQYWSAWNQHRWKKTLINDKPGVSVALVSGIGLVFEPHPEQHHIPNNEKLDMYHAEQTESLYKVFRLPILIFNTLALALLFWLIRRLIDDDWLAVWSIAGISLSPLLIGISQVVNPDALLWSCSALAIFAFLNALHKPEKKPLFILLSAFFLALALLSKYTAVILFPVFAIWIILLALLSRHSLREYTRYVLSYGTLCALTLLILPIAIPAFLVRPSSLFRLFLGGWDGRFLIDSPLLFVYPTILFGFLATGGFLLFLRRNNKKNNRRFPETISVFLKRHLPIAFFSLSILIFGVFFLARAFSFDGSLFHLVPFDIKNVQDFNEYAGRAPHFWEIFLLNINPLLFSIPPALIVFLFASWFFEVYYRFDKKLAFQKQKSSLPSNSLIPFALTLFVWIFPIANGLAGVILTPRYTILLYPIVAVLAAFGLRSILMYSSHKSLPPVLTTLYCFALATSVWLATPFYLNYTSDFLPTNHLISDAWGYGGFEAAQYINAQPDADTLVVWSDYFGVCEFIRGICITDYRYLPGKYRVDYYVVTRRGGIRYQPDHAQWRAITTIEPYKYYHRTNPDWQLIIDHRPENSVRIFKADPQTQP